MEKTPYIGQLGTLVRIYRMEKGLNTVNERVETPVLLCATKAAVTNNSGNEDTGNAIVHVTRATYTIRQRAGLMANEKLLLYDGDVQYNVEHVRKLGRSHLEVRVQSTGVVETPPDSGGGCDGIENFTSIASSPGLNGTRLYTLQGGNLIGRTEVVIVGVSTVVLDAGKNTFNAALNVGTTTIRWRKLCGATPVTEYAEQDVEVINTGPIARRLATVEPFDENDVVFPCSVGIVQTSLSEFDEVTDSGQVAADENEFVVIWNEVNPHIGVMAEPEYFVFPTIRYWQFTITPHDYKIPPRYAWSYLTE